MAMALTGVQFGASPITMPQRDLVPTYQRNGLRFGPQADEVGTYFEAIEKSICVRTHRDLLDWLQGEVQSFLRHSILLAAWGDFELGTISYDVVSWLSGVRTGCLDEQQTKLLLGSFFGLWQSYDRSPVAVRASDQLRSLVGSGSVPRRHDELSETETVLVHGIRDQRSRHDCLYVVIGDSALHDHKSSDALTFLLPFIDAALRRIPQLAGQHLPEARIPETAAEDSIDTSSFDLSQREKEILRWVGMGKTNHEIGIILDVSSFTVKNHLQRTFRKLNVMNRAQAIARLQTCPLPARLSMS